MCSDLELTGGPSTQTRWTASRTSRRPTGDEQTFYVAPPPQYFPRHSLASGLEKPLLHSLLTCQGCRMDRQVVHDWLRSEIGPYVNSQRTFADIVAALDSLRSLSPRINLYVSNKGHFSLLLHLKGTWPINFRGGTYNIPVQVWIPHAYTCESPIGYIVPTRDMLVRKTEHVELNGFIFGEYHVNWARKWRQEIYWRTWTPAWTHSRGSRRCTPSRLLQRQLQPPLLHLRFFERKQPSQRSALLGSPSSMAALHAQKPLPPLPPPLLIPAHRPLSGRSRSRHTSLLSPVGSRCRRQHQALVKSELRAVHLPVTGPQESR